MPGGRRYAGPSGKRTVVDLKGAGQITVRSSLEARVADQLVTAGVEFGYENRLYNYVQRRKYTPDFVLRKSDGTDMVIEVKGMFTAEDRSKMKAVRDEHPGLDIRFLFSNARTKLRRGAKSSYGDWCDKNNFEYCEAKLPQEWIDE